MTDTVSHISDLKKHCRSFWSGYEFHDPALELLFNKQHQSSFIKYLQIWCIMHLLFDLAFPITMITYKPGLFFFLSQIPNILITAATLLPVWFIPRVRQHAVLMIAIAAVLMAGSSGWLVHAHTTVWLQNAKSNALNDVVNEIRHNKDAMMQLDNYLHNVIATSNLNFQAALGLSQLLLLMFVGLYRSTIVAAFMTPITFVGVMVMSPVLRDQYDTLLIRGSALLVASGFLVFFMAGKTLAQRRSFILSNHFEAELNLAVQASRKADSILNHTLKNNMADACGEIQLFLVNTCASDPEYSPLHSATYALQRGMRACRQRYAYLCLVGGRYVFSPHALLLREFAQDMVAGLRVTLAVPELKVPVDPTLLGLIFDNAVSNAFKHGHPDAPDVQFRIRVLDRRYEARETVHLSFEVANRANPLRPRVTEDYVAKVLAGAATTGPATSAMSDQIGLQHSFLAAKAHGMDICLEQIDDYVRFVVQGVVEVVSETDSGKDNTLPIGAVPDVSQIPGDLVVCCIDDSATARRLLKHHLSTLTQPDQVLVFGQDESEVEEFYAAAVAGAHIAILDQHLAYGNDRNILGTDIAQRLLAQGYGGLLCIRSANMALEDQTLYRSAGVHHCMGKDTLMKTMIVELKLAYLRHTRGDAEPPAPEPPNLHCPASPRLSHDSIATIEA